MLLYAAERRLRRGLELLPTGEAGTSFHAMPSSVSSLSVSGLPPGGVLLSAYAMALICSGVVPQRPPITNAPASRASTA